MMLRWLVLILFVSVVGLAETEQHAEDGKGPDATEAPKAERPKQKETTLKPEETRLLSAMFRIPTKTVEDVYGGSDAEFSIPKAVDAAMAGDEAPLARIAADLYGSLNREQADTAFGVVDKARNDEIAKNPRDARYMALLDRLFWAAKIVDGSPAQSEGSEKYNAVFDKAFKERQDRIADTKEKVKQALEGSEPAKEALRSRFNRKTLLAFVDAQRKAGNTKLANDIINAISFGGKNGNQKYLDMKVGKETHRLNLGLTSESMDKALTAYSNANGGLHSATLSKKAFKSPGRTFSVDEGGKLATKVADRAPRQSGRQARRQAAPEQSSGSSTSSAPQQQRTAARSQDSAAKPSAGQTTSSKPATGGGGGGGDLAGFVSKNCTGCHNAGDPEGTADGKIKKGSKVLSVAEAITATKRVPAMRDAVSDAVRSQLQAFAR